MLLKIELVLSLIELNFLALMTSLDLCDLLHILLAIIVKRYHL